MPRSRLSRLALALVGMCLAASACTSSGGEQRGDTSPATSAANLGFTDVAAQVGLDFRHGAFRWDVSPDPAAMLGGGLCWLDYDNDGWLDLYVVNSYAQSESTRLQAEGGLPRSALFRGVEGTFTDVSAGSGANLEVRGNGCVAADFDLDGHTDLYVTTDRAGALLWNDGDGTFTEGARPAGVEAFGWHTGAAVGDVNADGWPDLFVAGYVDLSVRVPDATQGFPNTYRGARDLLYLSEGRDDGGRVRFREVGRDAGLEVTNFEYGLGAAFFDVDHDDDLDLYLANDTNPNRLYENVPWPGGAGADPAGIGFRFEELAGKAGVADPNAGMGVAEGDYDGDGRPDLFVTNARGQVHAVYHGQPSDGSAPSFADVRADLGPDLGASTGWGVSWADLDLDTDLDLVIANGDVPITDLAADAEPLQAFGNLTAQGEIGRFEDLGAAAALDGIPPLVARGSAAADYDNDGDLDVAIGSIGGSLVLLRNDAVGGNWLEVDLGGFHPGAEVTAIFPDGTWLVRQVRAGGSYLSSEDPRCHFGLGRAREVRELVVRWPDGAETRLADVAANHVVHVQAPP